MNSLALPALRGLDKVFQAKLEWETSVDALAHLVMLVDEHGRVRRANRALENWGLGKVNDAVGHLVHEVVHPGCNAEHCELHRFLEGMRLQRLAAKRVETELYDSVSGRHLSLSCYDNSHGDRDRLPGAVPSRVLVVQDISNRKKNEETLRFRVTESERGRIARDLHDGVGQSLATIKFMMQSILDEVHARQMEPTQSGCHACALPSTQGLYTARLEKLLGNVQSAIDEVRHVSMGLRPSILDNLGIVEAARWFCLEFQSTAPYIEINQHFDVDEGRVPKELKLPVFRLLQESMNNVVKHSGASVVDVTFEEEGEALRLCIEDNGRGFVQDGKQRGFGLRSMRERASSTDGHLDIVSQPGRGTRVELTWALS